MTRVSTPTRFKMAVLLWVSAYAWGQNSCDLNGDGAVNTTDINLAVSMTLGQSPCTANVAGPNVCTAVTVQRVVNASVAGGSCLSHWVSLTWTASVSANIAGYNVYRSTSPSGPFTKVNTQLVTGLNYVDLSVNAGQTYYYTATAVDTLGQESSQSGQTSTTVPTP